MKSRLEQLDDIEEGSVRETLNLNQAEYLRKIEELNQNLINSWDNDQRVKALKIAIQVWGTSKTCIKCLVPKGCTVKVRVVSLLSSAVLQTAY